MKYYLYRLYKDDADAEIYGCFNSLSAAAMSAKLLLIQDYSFILSEDMSKIYFYNTDGSWDYDILTEDGKLSFLDIYPNPKDYIVNN